MTRNSEESLPEPVRLEIQTRHPGIADEIQGAIDTLRKLQLITGTIAPGPPPVGADKAPAATATTDATIAPSSSGDHGEAKSPGNAGAKQGMDRDLPVLAPSESFGRYQIVRLLGRGAMGAVYLAYDSQLERHVALKTPFLGDNPHVIARFYREARATAQLRSPYICPIYEVDQISGIYYISMAFIDGKPLERVIADGHLKDGRAVAEVTKKIARGLQKAHDQGIIHRDLKPDNIMVDSDGDPIVMDFGLARRVDDDIQVTAPGRLLGTPAYMSPEQVEGDPRKIGPATDIYSLGVVLFKMLTGRIPFQGSLTSVLRQIGSEPPPRPSALAPGIGQDSPLENICLRMMAKSPADRFPSLANVVEALDEAFSREGLPLSKSSVFARVWSWLPRIFVFRSRAGKAGKATPETRPERPLADSRQVTPPPAGSDKAPSPPPGKPLADPSQVTLDREGQGDQSGKPAKPLADPSQVTLGREGQGDQGGDPGNPLADPNQVTSSGTNWEKAPGSPPGSLLAETGQWMPAGEKEEQAGCATVDLPAARD
jgi:serine/threonine protein kinase